MTALEQEVYEKIVANMDVDTSELQGFDELQSSLEKMGEDLEFGAGVDRALRAGAEPIYRQMKANASSNPKIITGALNKSIKKSGVRKRKGRKQITIGVHHKEYSAYYSNPVEYVRPDRALMKVA